MNASLAAVRDASDLPSSPRRAQPLPSPAALREALPLSGATAARIQQQRDQVRAILRGDDPRLLVVAGPCSLHDADAALEYGRRLRDLAVATEDRLLLVMRAYVEKPRTTVGWKGLLYDPHLDGRGDLAEGLRRSRRLLLDLAELGLPLASELLSPLAADYLADTLSWAAIGARTTESQIHREMVSGLDLPVGFKNGTDGELGAARDAMGAAAHPHAHLGIDDHGHPALIQTAGNPDTHLVLRGGRRGPNYDADSVAAARRALEAAGLNPRLMVDCSHANSGKDPARQPRVLEDILAQRRGGDRTVAGVMLESHLRGGNQPLTGELAYGVSITDACLGWDDTEACLRALAADGA
ncbi:3-deoxy-7-phosphoheptulonate synthase [Alloalcanivorax marinus]|uniref:3-deoxy-7-phosphoheptulonate synthase n=1 Tax=Alloalcanivorax marinus TaxID=1177169 RepID=UPI00195E2AC7|nr:3-deoxy-7-phosphoheptulonate synthase [Alloalcanivorax marinus]MBM7333584.1 3-deoxy-7-phosphoheptulonate synthase [Alloalcanivorax marinus]